VRSFIQCLGIYPVGTPVRLDSGELALVIRQNSGEPLRPWVRLLSRADGTELAAPEDANLSADARAVREVVDSDLVGGSLEEILCQPVRWRQGGMLSVILGDRPSRASAGDPGQAV